jgi:hypothetical protein
MVPVTSNVQPTGTGPASDWPPNASDNAPAATVPSNVSRKRGLGRPAEPAAAIPLGQAQTFVIEIPKEYNGLEISLDGIG